MNETPTSCLSFRSLSYNHPSLRSILTAVVISVTVFRDSSSSAFAIPNTFSQQHVPSKSRFRTPLARGRSSCNRQKDEGNWIAQKRKQSSYASRLISSVGALRAGGKSTAMDDADAAAIRQRKRQERRISISLAATYFAVMGAKCALPAVLPLLLSPSVGLTFPAGAEPQQLFARQLTVATMAVALGKLCLGPVIDHLGGSLSLKIALACLTCLLGTISVSQSFTVFTCCWILVDFCFSSCWAACLNAIHENFDESRWGREIGNLATAARAGNSVAFAAFAWVLSIFQERKWMVQYWRPVFLAATVAQIIPLMLLALLPTKEHTQPLLALRPNKRVQAKPSIRTSLRILQQEARKLDFWLHLISRSALMLFASFLLFVPTFMSSVFYLSSAGGAQVGSLYALGCLLSVSTLSNIYTRLQRKTKCWAVSAFLLCGATGSSVSILGHVLTWWKLPPVVCALLFFLWGFSFSVPFYLPPSIYALSRGGEECSATIADAFDVGGFALLALFNGYVAGIKHSNVAAWVPTFVILTACSLTSFLALLAATVREKNTEFS